MSNQISRGTKRICQSAACALPFYDLNRTDVWCPNCGTAFDKSVVLHPRSDPTDPRSWRGNRRNIYPVAPPVAKLEPPPQFDDEADATPIVDDVDADAIPLRDDDGDDEITDVVMPPEDDKVDQ